MNKSLSIIILNILNLFSTQVTTHPVNYTNYQKLKQI